MEVLPDLVLHLIADYLSGSELAAWCAVSRSWRDRLNQDDFWRRRCDPETAEYLRQTECQVQPIFINPEEEGESGLSAICEWRLAFMREIHLWNNWRQNLSISIFVPDETNSEVCFINSVFAHKQLDHAPLLIYKNDFLVVCNNNELQLWKVEHSAFKICEKTLLDKRIIMLNISGDSVVVKQHDLVQIFEISVTKKEFVFKNSFVTSPTFSVVLNGCLLIEVQNSPFTIQVWNVESGEKVKEEKSESTRLTNSGLCISETYLILMANSKNHQGRIMFWIFVYKLPDFDLVLTSKFYEIFIIEAVVIVDHIFITIPNYIDVYYLKNGQHIKQIHISSITNLEKFENKICCADMLGNLLRLTPSTGDVETISFNRGLGMISLDRLNSKYFLSTVSGYLRILSLVQMEGRAATHVKELGHFTDIRLIQVNKARTKIYISFYVHCGVTSDFIEHFEVVSFW